MHNTFKTTLELVNPAKTDERAETILKNVKQEMKMIPNMYLAMANTPELLETYLYGYKKFRKDAGFSPQEQEVIFLTISYENGCDYCLAAHSIVADFQSKVPMDVTEAIRNGEEISDSKLKALSEFTMTMLNKRGRPAQEDVDKFLTAGYSQKHILSIILAISVKTISNYTNHLFHTPLDAAFKVREWKGYKVAGKIVQFFRGS